MVQARRAEEKAERELEGLGSPTLCPRVTDGCAAQTRHVFVSSSQRDSPCESPRDGGLPFLQLSWSCLPAGGWAWPQAFSTLAGCPVLSPAPCAGGHHLGLSCRWLLIRGHRVLLV